MVTSSGQPSDVTSNVTSSVSSTVTEEEQPEVIEEGMDPSELMASAVSHTLEVQHKGKKWSFEYRDLNWSEKYKCIDSAQDWQEGEFKFSLSKYYLNALETMIIESPIRPFTATTIGNLDTSVVAQLIAVVPPPSDEVASTIKKA